MRNEPDGVSFPGNCAAKFGQREVRAAGFQWLGNDPERHCNKNAKR